MKKLTFSALAAILWGCWIANPAWNSFTVSQAYVVMAKIAPEEIWGVAVLLIGLVGMFASLTNRLRLEMVIAIVLFAVWTALTITFAFGALSSTASVNYIVPALLSIDGYIAARMQWLREKQ